ncbi:unnamed protein product [Musa hybrid cultivar]
MVELRGLGVSGAFRLGSSLSGCDVVTVRSCPVLEPEWLSLLGWLCGKPVLPLGHFPPAAMKHDVAGSFTEGNDFFRWLGKREVADGLEISNQGPGTGDHGWVPRIKILANPSVGGFMTHCGWNSLVEVLQFGLPLVLLPLANYEGLNAHLMAEKKVGVEVPRREEARPSMGMMSQGQ